MKLTKKQIQKVREAAEMIDKGEQKFCCNSLEFIEDVGDRLVFKFGYFYGKTTTWPWYFSFDVENGTWEDVKAYRVMALLLFAEIAGEGINP